MYEVSRLLVYKEFMYDDLFYTMSELIENTYHQKDSKQENKKLYDCAHMLIELSDKYGFEGNLWHTFLAFLLANNENAYSTVCERTGEISGSINLAVKNDMDIFYSLMNFELKKLDDSFDSDSMKIISSYKHYDGKSKVFNKRIRDRICELAVNLEMADNPDTFKNIVTTFYKNNGVGKFGLNKAFRVEENTDNPNEVDIIPITSIEHIYLNDLIGYEIQKKKLVDNTEAFLHGKKCNNCLLFGDSGTGKSSSIKAILNEYYDDGLRMIEVYKHQFGMLSKVIEQIKDRNYRYIIYMDDLSFEEYEIEYKYLKAIIEGGLGKKPDNVLIYATSNRRHLVREKWSDKEERRDDMHSSDTVQEKLSLVARFGVSIFYGSPSKQEYENIVKLLASKYNITMPQEKLFAEANKWELSHGGLSCRSAGQFINYLLGQE